MSISIELKRLKTIDVQPMSSKKNCTNISFSLSLRDDEWYVHYNLKAREPSTFELLGNLVKIRRKSFNHSVKSDSTQKDFQPIYLAISIPRRTPKNYDNKELYHRSDLANTKMKRLEFDLKIPPHHTDPRLAGKAPSTLHLTNLKEDVSK